MSKFLDELNEEEHGKYNALVQAARTFVDRCEKGSIMSRRTYAEMKMALQAIEAPVPFVPVDPETK